ncbi:MAG: hypothetical protein HKO66_12365 [Saprospiraceae bacterium]|nr:hypothetical protein [Bacteroidia bacterium]NNE14461.1 hypothetical protein [Saprospiraceae bacterium]NNL93024.1 hypothetical protein [Saprospiraceae bacterium]
MARKATNKKTEEYNLTNAIKTTTKNVNAFVLETTEEVIETAIERGVQWQEVSEKAIKGSLKLAENQQDVMFKALETLKESIMKGSRRFKGVFSNN